MKELVSSLFVVLLFGCMKPPRVDVFVEIKPNETAYVVPLEGDNLDNQGKFDSAEYLDKIKVASKRIRIPLTEKKIGRFPWNIEWIPSAMVVKVNRSPVTREWNNDKTKGTSEKQEGIEVESSDSIGFSVGVNITAMIEETNTSLFLYTYAGKTLEEIMDTNVRGETQSLLSSEFGSLTLTECKTKKGEIYKRTGDSIKSKFSQFGITIISFGNMGGLIYSNPEIQQSIDKAYQAEMDVQVAKQEKLAQDERNSLMVAKVVAEREAAEEFQKAEESRAKQIVLDVQKMQAEAFLEMSKKWDGKLPSNILPEGSPLLLGLNNLDKPQIPSQVSNPQIQNNNVGTIN